MTTSPGSVQRVAHTALAPVDRSMVMLRFGIDVPQALSVAEISTVLGLSRDMVYRRLKDALALLRKIMDDNLECQGLRSRGKPVHGGTLAPRNAGSTAGARDTRLRAGHH